MLTYILLWHTPDELTKIVPLKWRDGFKISMAVVDDLWKAHASYKKNWVNYDIYGHFWISLLLF